MSEFEILAAMTTYGWRPGAGDPSVMGWIVFTVYLVSAALAWRAARSEQAMISQGVDGLLPRVWFVLAALLLLLALNKQLDLHNTITAVGRSLAREQGWYRQRRLFQLALVAVALGTASLSAAWLWWKVGRPHPRYRLPLLAASALVGFILMRMASFHHIDQALRVEWLGGRFHAWIEALAACYLGILAWRRANVARWR